MDPHYIKKNVKTVHVPSVEQSRKLHVYFHNIELDDQV